MSPRHPFSVYFCPFTWLCHLFFCFLVPRGLLFFCTFFGVFFSGQCPTLCRSWTARWEAKWSSRRPNAPSPTPSRVRSGRPEQRSEAACKLIASARERRASGRERAASEWSTASAAGRDASSVRKRRAAQALRSAFAMRARDAPAASLVSERAGERIVRRTRQACERRAWWRIRSPSSGKQ